MGCEGEWQKKVREEVEKRAVQEWKDGVRRGKKLDVYLRIKDMWGFEEYLEGLLGRGEVLLARFRVGVRQWGRRREDGLEGRRECGQRTGRRGRESSRVDRVRGE